MPGLSDKGRQFFDSLFGSLKNSKKHKRLERDSWNAILKSLFKTLYFFDHCNNKQQHNYFFTIVFENISIEMLSLLIIISQNYSFVKIRRSEKIKLNNDLKSNFKYKTKKYSKKSSKSSFDDYNRYHYRYHYRYTYTY
jgi:hypothetical protein